MKHQRGLTKEGRENYQNPQQGERELGTAEYRPKIAKLNNGGGTQGWLGKKQEILQERGT